MSIRIVGVVGAGVIGSGVIQALAESEFQVVAIDRAEKILKQAREEIRNGIRLRSLLKKQVRGSVDEILKRIEFSTDCLLLKEADFVIENVTESWDVKKDVYARLDATCNEPCIFAANTSAIPITRIASLTTRPEKVIGIHFMNPVPIKPMVELIAGYHTSQDTIEATKILLGRMGKDYIQVNDSPGFVSNRVLMLTINEAIFLLQEQVASAEDVDRIFKTCFEHKTGPLETADLIGLDTILLSLEVLCESFNDSKYRPCPLLKKMVDAGLYGRKSGKGFYEY